MLNPSRKRQSTRPPIPVTSHNRYPYLSVNSLSLVPTATRLVPPTISAAPVFAVPLSRHSAQSPLLPSVSVPLARPHVPLTYLEMLSSVLPAFPRRGNFAVQDQDLTAVPLHRLSIVSQLPDSSHVEVWRSQVCYAQIRANAVATHLGVVEEVNAVKEEKVGHCQ